MAKDATPASEVMSAAELKPLLLLSKRKPVPCAVAMTNDKQGVILLNRRTKPRKLMAELIRQSKAAGQDLERATIRFGRVTVDGGSDSATVHIAINKDAPGQLRPALLAKLRPAGFQRCEITLDAKLEDETDEDEPDSPDEAAPPPPPTPDPAPAPQQPASKPATPASTPTPAPTAQAGPEATGRASSAPPDAATLRRDLYSLAQQIVPVRAADPARANDLLEAANAANANLKSGDLPKAQTSIENLRQQLQAATPPPAPASSAPAPDPLLTPVRQPAAPPTAQDTAPPQGPDATPPPTSKPPSAAAPPPDAHARPGAPPPIDPATLPPGPLDKATYETVDKRNRYLQTLYDPQSTEDHVISVFTGGLNDPANLITDAERAEHKALSAKIIETLNPRPTPEEARLDAMAASPLGTIASVATRGLGGNQDSQDLALGLGTAVDGIGIALAAGRPAQGAGPVTLASRRGTTGLPPRRVPSGETQIGAEPLFVPDHSFEHGAVVSPPEVSSKDISDFRTAIGVSETNTVGVARTNVRGLEGTTFLGASAAPRGQGGLPPALDGPITSPGPLPRDRNHAEQDIANQFVCRPSQPSKRGPRRQRAADPNSERERCLHHMSTGALKPQSSSRRSKTTKSTIPDSAHSCRGGQPRSKTHRPGGLCRSQRRIPAMTEPWPPPQDTPESAQFRAAAHSAGTAACIALLIYAAELALQTLPSGPWYETCSRALSLAARIPASEPVDPAEIVDAMHNESDEGPHVYLQLAPEPQAFAWAAITEALGYAAYCEYRRIGEQPNSLLDGYAREDSLDLAIDPFVNVRTLAWSRLASVSTWVREHASKAEAGWGKPLHVEHLQKIAAG